MNRPVEFSLSRSNWLSAMAQACGSRNPSEGFRGTQCNGNDDGDWLTTLVIMHARNVVARLKARADTGGRIFGTCGCYAVNSIAYGPQNRFGECRKSGLGLMV